MRLMQGSDWSLPTEAEGEKKMMEKSMAPTWPLTRWPTSPSNEPTKQMDKRGAAPVERHHSDKTDHNLFSSLLFWFTK